jgi:hypothetical protein
MNPILKAAIGGAGLVALVVSAPAARAQDTPQAVDWQSVDTAFGRKPVAVAGDVHRYSFPRSDLTVTVDGVQIKPSLALGGWIAIKPEPHGAMAMGDLVLLDSEINPVLSELATNGIDVTAIHNHLLRSNPATFYLHVGAHGDPVSIANRIRDALLASNTPLDVPAATPESPVAGIDTAQLDQIIGAKGQNRGGVYQLAVPRQAAITEGGRQMAPAGPLGLATGIAFQPTGNGKAAITGDFVLTADEVNPVIQTLRSKGIEVTAVHSHMLSEEPRLFFMHFWANDDALRLARGLRDALDKTASAKG